MTDTPSPPEHDPLADALRDARGDVRPISGDALVAAARSAKDARSRRRKRVTGGALGAAAAVLLVAVAAVALQDHSSTQVVKSARPDRPRRHSRPRCWHRHGHAIDRTRRRPDRDRDRTRLRCRHQGDVPRVHAIARVRSDAFRPELHRRRRAPHDRSAKR